MISISKCRTIKRLIGFGIVLPTLWIIASSFIKSNSSGLDLGSEIPMSEKKMEGYDGGSYDLKGLSNKNGIMVVFTCNTCPFVIGNDTFEGWEKQYNSLYETAKDNAIGFVLINSNVAKRGDVDSKEAMKKRAFTQKYKMNYLVDENASIADAFGAKTTPHVFIFDGKNQLIYKGSIDNSWDSNRKKLKNYASNALKAIGANKKVKTSSSQPRGCSIKRK